MWYQTEISLSPRPRGFHIITDEVIRGIPELQDISVGVLHVFMKHTSASLAINEDADPTVRTDFESHFNQMRKWQVEGEKAMFYIVAIMTLYCC